MGQETFLIEKLLNGSFLVIKKINDGVLHRALDKNGPGCRKEWRHENLNRSFLTKC